MQLIIFITPTVHILRKKMGRTRLRQQDQSLGISCVGRGEYMYLLLDSPRRFPMTSCEFIKTEAHVLYNDID